MSVKETIIQFTIFLTAEKYATIIWNRDIFIYNRRGLETEVERENETESGRERGKSRKRESESERKREEWWEILSGGEIGRKRK